MTGILHHVFGNNGKWQIEFISARSFQTEEQYLQDPLRVKCVADRQGVWMMM